MLDHALFYAAHWGWRVFVLSQSKTPLKLCGDCPPHGVDGHDGETCECLTCHGFYAATTEPDRITEMLNRHPDGLLATRTGAASGIAVVDIDSRHGGDESFARLEDHCAIPETRTAFSPGGAHLFFAHPGHPVKSGANVFADDLPGLDSKADGGYVLVAPSVRRDGGDYVWSRPGGRVGELAAYPPMLVQLLDPPQPAPRFHAPAGYSTRSSGYARAALLDEVELVSAAADGGRHEAIRRASFSLGQLVGGGLLDRDEVFDALAQAAACVGSVGRKTEDTIRSGIRKGETQPRGGVA